jgi:LTXXQ motif family protein
MFKTVAAGAAVLMIAAGAVVYAQQPPGSPESGRRAFGAEDRAAFLEARIAALHAGLRLSADQEKAWPAFEQAYRDLAALRGRHQSAGPGDPDEALDHVQRIQRRAEALTAHGAALKRYADALASLYGTFHDGQKRRFGLLSHHPHFHHHFAFWRDRREPGFRGEFGPSPRGEFAPPRRRFGEGGERGEFGLLRGEPGDLAEAEEEFSPPR